MGPAEDPAAGGTSRNLEVPTEIQQNLSRNIQQEHPDVSSHPRSDQLRSDQQLVQQLKHRRPTAGRGGEENPGSEGSVELMEGEEGQTWPPHCLLWRKKLSNKTPANTREWSQRREEVAGEQEQGSAAGGGGSTGGASEGDLGLA